MALNDLKEKKKRLNHKRVYSFGSKGPKPFGLNK
jgi:hypothetical protein